MKVSLQSGSEGDNDGDRIGVSTGIEMKLHKLVNQRCRIEGEWQSVNSLVLPEGRKPPIQVL